MGDRRSTSHSNRPRVFMERRQRKSDRRRHRGMARLLFINLGALWNRFLSRLGKG